MHLVVSYYITFSSANGSTEITKLFYSKYRSLYSGKPTDDNELREIHDRQ